MCTYTHTRTHTHTHVYATATLPVDAAVVSPVDGDPVQRSYAMSDMDESKADLYLPWHHNVLYAASPWHAGRQVLLFVRRRLLSRQLRPKQSLHGPCPNPSDDNGDDDTSEFCPLFFFRFSRHRVRSCHCARIKQSYHMPARRMM